MFGEEVGRGIGGRWGGGNGRLNGGGERGGGFGGDRCGLVRGWLLEGGLGQLGW